MREKAKTVAVLLAAGEGRRFKSSIPKQYVKIHGKPILYYTLQKFLDSGVFSEIIIVVNTNWIENCPAIINPFLSERQVAKLRYIEGGDTRSQSSYNAVKFLRNKKIDFILFHDCVRPFIEVSLIQKVVRAAKKYGAAIPAIKALESVAIAKNEKVTNALVSRDLYFMQTPECFRFDDVVEAYDTFSHKKKYFDTATNLHLLSDLKKEIHLVIHSERNLKLTFAPDIVIASALLDQ